MARGFGGQRLMVFPEEDLIAAFTGWDILKDPAGDGELINRILRRYTRKPATPLTREARVGPVSQGERRFSPLADSPRKPQKLKWAGNQEAVTFLGYRPIRS